MDGQGNYFNEEERSKSVYLANTEDDFCLNLGKFVCQTWGWLNNKARDVWII